LKGKGIFFLRTTLPGKPLNLTTGSDNDVLFGEISEHTIFSLNTIINSVYRPLVGSLDQNDWNHCEDEQKKDFL
jgi:hypothetical protein